MARTSIKGILNEQEHHIGNQPSLIGTITVDGNEYPIAGWVYFNKDGSITVSIEDTLLKNHRKTASRPKNAP